MNSQLSVFLRMNNFLFLVSLLQNIYSRFPNLYLRYVNFIVKNVMFSMFYAVWVALFGHPIKYLDEETGIVIALRISH